VLRCGKLPEGCSYAFGNERFELDHGVEAYAGCIIERFGRLWDLVQRRPKPLIP